MISEAVDVDVWIRAAPATVFSFFTDPAKYRRWMGLEATLDARVGGSFRIAMSPRSGFVGEYLVVDPPRRLVYTWGWAPKPGVDGAALAVPPGLRALPPGSTRVEVTLEPERDGTRVRIRHTGFDDESSRAIFAGGWPGYTRRLALAVEGVGAGPDPNVLP